MTDSTDAPRVRLPDRRLKVSEAIEWRGRTYLMSIGFDTAGVAREVFLDGYKAGSELEALLDDACVLASLQLQAGASAAALAAHLGREGTDPAWPEHDSGAASILGLVLRRAAALEASHAEGIREAYRALARAAQSPAAPPAATAET